MELITIDDQHKVQTLSSLGILYHRPVSIGIRKFEALNFVIQILVFSFNLTKYFSNPNFFLKEPYNCPRAEFSMSVYHELKTDRLKFC